jgi:hypothetical protein
VRVADLCEVSGLRLLWGAGEALQRPVTGTTTADLLEPGRYVAVGHLVLTGLTWRRDTADAAVFVTSVEAAGACALAVGEGLLGEVPDDVVEAARRAGLPVFAVPVDVAFHQVSASVEHTLGPRDDAVSRVLAAAAAGRSVGEVVAEVPGVRVFSATGRQLGGPECGQDEVDGLFAGVPGRPVGDGPAPWWLVGPGVAESSLAALAGILALHRRFAGGSGEEPAGEVVALAVDAERRDVLLDAVADLPHTADADAVLVPADALAVVRRRLDRTAGYLSSGLAVGVSRRGADREEAARGARSALAVARTRRGRVVIEREPDSGGVADLLRLVPAADRERFARRVLAGVLDDPDLLLTLRTHLRTGASPVRTATALHVHQNTVRYRLNRVESLLDRDLRDVDDLVDLQVALTVLDQQGLGQGQ